MVISRCAKMVKEFCENTIFKNWLKTFFSKITISDLQNKLPRNFMRSMWQSIFGESEFATEKNGFC